MTETAPLRRHAQPVGPVAHAGRLLRRLGRRGRRRAWCRSPTATTAAARSGSRPPAAGSSGSSPSAAASRWRPRLGGLFLVVDGVLTAHGRRDRAASLDVLAGPELGDAYVGPAARPALRRPGADEPRRAADRGHDEVADRRRRSTPRDRRPPRTPPSCCARSATRSWRPSRPGRDPALLRACSRPVRPRGLRRRSPSPAMLAGPRARRRGHGAAELGDVPALLQDDRLDSGAAAELQMQAVGRAVVQWTAQYDARADARARRAPAAARARSTPQSATPMADVRALRAVHALHGRSANVTGLARRSRSRCSHGDDGRLPLGVQLVGQPGRRGRAAGARGAARGGPARGPTAAPPVVARLA